MSKADDEARARAAYEGQVRAEGFDRWLWRSLNEALAAIPPVEEDHEFDRVMADETTQG